MGIILPLLPTTPFLLLAVWAFSKSSPEMAERIRNHRLAGPYIRDWQDEGVIPPKAKFVAIAMMSAMLVYLLMFSDIPQWTASLAAVILAAVALYIVTRPGRRKYGP